MNHLKELRRLLVGNTPTTIQGTVVSMSPGGRVSVRTPRTIITCTTVVPVAEGDRVSVQGTLIVGKQSSAEGLPEYRV